MVFLCKYHHKYQKPTRELTSMITKWRIKTVLPNNGTADTLFQQNKGTHLYPANFFNKIAYCNPSILCHKFPLSRYSLLFYIFQVSHLSVDLVEGQNLQTSTQISWPKYILPAQHPVPVLHNTRLNSTSELFCKFTSIYDPRVTSAATLHTNTITPNM